MARVVLNVDFTNVAAAEHFNVSGVLDFTLGTLGSSEPTIPYEPAPG
ncbi:hypothetical protein MHPYR_40227 [uncultured Mycobacterium sp.]|uniref:Uncharacterized protein n=1 Tax=uncultured Mycobacterium sp. TaxID=171292 RepID=A0A1Y5PET3_9MYCO|nr:hypothetical protein MHPYR_40227 [uncultured Mycobacterium sp.]